MAAHEKEQLRKDLLAKRAALSPDEVARESEHALFLLRSMQEWQEAGEVLIYWPIRGEIDVRPMVRELWDRGTRVLMPRCRPDAYGEMDIACAACEADLAEGAFSIMEPDSDKCPPVETCCPDIAIVPAVCFDRRGYRLGYGGGYYDRLLATDGMDSTLTIGIGYTFQLVEELPVQPWDMPVDIICTEEELWRP